MSKDNHAKRIEYSKEMMNKSFDYWRTVLWSDESKLNHFDSDGKVMVWECFFRNGMGEFVFY
jgi:hypothetical protein